MEWGPIKKHLMGLVRFISGMSFSYPILSENPWWKERSSFQSYPPPSTLALANEHLHTHRTYPPLKKILNI